MKFNHKMESVLIAITAVLCTILLLKLLYKLRFAVPWRVNCWFCNNNFWIKLSERNSWTCLKCEQYNGFTKDGDYNKPVGVTNEKVLNTPNIFQRSPPKNGLCKMCNINQQLKVTQLANFIPMNDKNFDNEIDTYKLQLEKAYKLCSPCKRVLQMKLHKEKETLLISKLVENRSPENRDRRENKQKESLHNFLNSTSMTISAFLIVLVSIELYNMLMLHHSFVHTINLTKRIIGGIFERIASIIKMKMVMTFPSLDTYTCDMKYLQMDYLTKGLNLEDKQIEYLNKLTQISLGAFICMIEIIGHVWNPNNFKYTVLIDLLWTVFVILSIAHHIVAVDPMNVALFKLLCILTIFLLYKKMTQAKKVGAKIIAAPNVIEKQNGKIMTSYFQEEETLALDTDDDVSLSKFGLHNLTDSSSDTIGPLSNSLISGRCFTPRSDSLWTKPRLNSTFCVNSVISKSPSSVSDNVFIKPSFNKYQKLAKEDSDSELDESISSLCIGSPKKAKKNSNSVFSIRKFSATPNFVTPAPASRSRPLISPSKLGHSTSWVAGGYWGLEGERQIFNLNGSRSSSQSSGFESQASSLNQRNVFSSQPPSREESICGEQDRTLMFDRFQNCSVNNFGNYQQSFSRFSSPVFPQMQYNSHVHIPQPRVAPQSYAHGGVFKTPGGSGIIKLPQNPFVSN